MKLQFKIETKFLKQNNNDCILWSGFVIRNNTKNSYGIPYIYDNSVKPRKSINVCRFLLEKKLGRCLKVGYKALHTCDNVYGPCVNINHLYEGTQKDNVQDMVRRGRQPSYIGELHPNSKLTNDDVLTILILLDKGIQQKLIAKQFNVDPSYISNIKNGRARIKERV